MTHEFKLIPRDESIVVREDEMIEAAAKVLKGAEPDGPGIDWPEQIPAEDVEPTVRSLSRRTGHRIGRKTTSVKGTGLVNVHFYRLGEPRKRKAKEDK